ncbi:MAG TPA: hypothetical protein VFG87_01585 [Amycolatopsis sp.]|nr:hypothetical protein [Amycolatopsis sp.]
MVTVAGAGLGAHHLVADGARSCVPAGLAAPGEQRSRPRVMRIARGCVLGDSVTRASNMVLGVDSPRPSSAGSEHGSRARRQFHPMG